MAELTQQRDADRAAAARRQEACGPVAKGIGRGGKRAGSCGRRELNRRGGEGMVHAARAEVSLEVAGRNEGGVFLALVCSWFSQLARGGRQERAERYAVETMHAALRALISVSTPLSCGICCPWLLRSQEASMAMERLREDTRQAHEELDRLRGEVDQAKKALAEAGLPGR